MRFTQDIPTYNASIYLRTKKKIPQFMIHAANSVRIAIDAGNSGTSMSHCIIVCTVSLIVKVIAY
jgi:hypothetical protein